MVKLGTDITRSRLGDRVVTDSCGTIRNDARFEAYRRYALTTHNLTVNVRCR
jgi:hypothetical protein